MDFKCIKVRRGRGSPYNEADGEAVIRSVWDVYMEPVETQGDVEGGIASIRLVYWKSCPIVENNIYEVDLNIKPIIFKMVRE